MAAKRITPKWLEAKLPTLAVGDRYVIDKTEAREGNLRSYISKINAKSKRRFYRLQFVDRCYYRITVTDKTTQQ